MFIVGRFFFFDIMRVLFVRCSSNLYGGASKSFMNMLDGLMKLGIRPLVVFPATDGMCELYRNKGIPTAVLNYRLAVYPPLRYWKDYVMFLPRLCGRIWVNYTASRKLVNIVRAFQPDIIHTNVSVIDIGYRVSKQLKIPHIYHVREYGDKDFSFFHYPLRSCFLKKLQKHSFAICITKDIQRYYNLDADNSCVIYNGVCSESQIRFSPHKKNYFLFAGRLEPAKGVGELLMAFADFCMQRPDLDIRLKIAGGTNNIRYYDFLLNEVKRLHIEERVDFLGVRKDVNDLMADAYLMIVPSKFEGFGRITAEAMQNGALVLGHNTAGTKEQFDNGLEMTGEEIALRYTTHQELVRAMCEVVDQGVEYYFPMIERSQQVIKALYTNERNALQVYEFYNQILN